MNYYENIKEELINNEINKKVKDYSKNKTELQTYYNVGKMLSEAGNHYGESIIKNYSIKLTKELGIKYTYTTLSRMRQFYLIFSNIATVWQLSWSHYKILIPLKNIVKIKYYINRCINCNLSTRELEKIVKEKEYERLPESTKEKLKKEEQLELTDSIKNPILIKNNLNIEKISEKVLQKLVIEDIENVMNQLGEGFSYISKEYKIKLGKDYNYIDILLYNVIYHSYVVVELKITNLKKEHIGQVQIYMNYIDENIKGINDNKTIGIIIVKENNEYIVKYSSDKRIKVTNYLLI